MQALRIVAHLRRPVPVGAYPIMLDGVLAAARVMQAEDEGSAQPWDWQHDLPLQRQGSRNEWLFCASQFWPTEPNNALGLIMVPQTSRHSLARLTKDHRVGLLKMGASKINPAGGTFKASFEMLQMRQYSALQAYAVGERDKVTALLARIRHLGARRSLFCGEVARWEVEEIPAEVCLWFVRPLSLQVWEGLEIGDGCYARAMQTLRPPYWRRTEAQDAMVPIDPAKIVATLGKA